MKLYFAPGACSFVPHTLLETIGEPFEAALVKIHKQENLSAEYRAINPRGQVPVLVDGDDVLTQILAIVVYLDEKYPQHGFLPRAPLAKARVLETLAWMNNTAHPTFTHVFMPFKFAASEQSQAEMKVFNAQQYRSMLGEIEAMVGNAQAGNQQWLGGAAFGPLDAYALTLLRWGGLAGIDPTGFPLLWAHGQKVAQLPAVARAIDRERLQLNVYRPA